MKATVYARFLKRGVNLGLVNPSLKGNPEGKFRCRLRFGVFETRVTSGFANPGVTRQTL